MPPSIVPLVLSVLFPERVLKPTRLFVLAAHACNNSATHTPNQPQPTPPEANTERLTPSPPSALPVVVGVLPPAAAAAAASSAHPAAIAPRREHAAKNPRLHPAHRLRFVPPPPLAVIALLRHQLRWPLQTMTWTSALR